MIEMHGNNLTTATWLSPWPRTLFFFFAKKGNTMSRLMQAAVWLLRIICKTNELGILLKLSKVEVCTRRFPRILIG